MRRRLLIPSRVHFLLLTAVMLHFSLISTADASPWRVQVMAVHDFTFAVQAEEQLERSGYSPVGIHWQDGIYKVWVGAHGTRAEASELQQQLAGHGFEDAFVLQLGPDIIADTPVQPSIKALPYFIQVFSFTTPELADRAAEHARRKTGYDVRIFPGDGLYRVQLGPFESRDAADFAKQVILGRGYVDAFLVPAEH